MRSVFSLVILLVVQMQCAQYFPNLYYLSSGYDIFQGNPHKTSAGVDDGFKQSVFSFDYATGQTTPDGRYYVPDKMNFQMDRGYIINFNSKEVHNSAQYVSALEVDASVDFKGYGAKFSASTDFKKTKNATEKYHKVIVESSAVCSIYQGSFSLSPAPALDPTFVAAIRKLPSGPNMHDYAKFFEYYGTHYVYWIKMGAKFGFQSVLTESNYNSLKTQNIKIEAAASYSGFGITGSANSLTQTEKQNAATFASKRSSYSIFSLGTRPPKGGDGNDWSQQNIDNPMPIQYKLRKLSEVMTCSVFPCQGTADSNHLEDVKNSYLLVLEQYCPWLQSLGKVDSCPYLNYESLDDSEGPNSDGFLQ